MPSQKLSDAQHHRRAPSGAPRQTRQNPSGAVKLNDRITARIDLLNLRKWARELNTTHARSYRWIASHTTRGRTAHGYWQMIANGAHLLKPRKVAPTVCDLLEIKRLVLIVREFREQEIQINEAALRFHDAMVQAQSSAFDFVRVTMRRKDD